MMKITYISHTRVSISVKMFMHFLYSNLNKINTSYLFFGGELSIYSELPILDYFIPSSLSLAYLMSTVQKRRT